MDDFVEDTAVLGGLRVLDLVACQVGLRIEWRYKDRIVHVGVLGLRPVVIGERLTEERLLKADDAMLVHPSPVESVAHERQAKVQMDHLGPRQIFAQLMIGAFGSEWIENSSAVASDVLFARGLHDPHERIGAVLAVHLIIDQIQELATFGAIRRLAIGARC